MKSCLKKNENDKSLYFDIQNLYLKNIADKCLKELRLDLKILKEKYPKLKTISFEKTNSGFTYPHAINGIVMKNEVFPDLTTSEKLTQTFFKNGIDSSLLAEILNDIYTTKMIELLGWAFSYSDFFSRFIVLDVETQSRVHY